MAGAVFVPKRPSPGLDQARPTPFQKVWEKCGNFPIGTHPAKSKGRHNSLL